MQGRSSPQRSPLNSSRSGTKPKQLRSLEVVVEVVEVVAEVVLTLSKAPWTPLWSLAEVAEAEAEGEAEGEAEVEVVVVLHTTTLSL